MTIHGPTVSPNYGRTVGAGLHFEVTPPVFMISCDELVIEAKQTLGRWPPGGTRPEAAGEQAMGRTMANLERTVSTAAMALDDLEWPAAPLNLTGLRPAQQ